MTLSHFVEALELGGYLRESPNARIEDRERIRSFLDGRLRNPWDLFLGQSDMPGVRRSGGLESFRD